jgi:hypothetical protein
MGIHIFQIIGLTTAFLLLPQAALGQAARSQFAFPDLGATSRRTDGTSNPMVTGYAKVANSDAVPAGYALIALQSQGTLVSEITVPTATAFRGGRIYAETGGGVDTGLALANLNAEPIPLAWYFTRSTGEPGASGILTLPAKGQIGQFLSEAPFNLAPDFQGTFTFFALTPKPDLSVAAIALRGLINQRGDFVMTTLPVTPLDEHPLFAGDTLPHFAVGAGWSTQIVLVNPTDQELAGTAAFVDPAGAAVVVAAETGADREFAFRIAPKGSWRLRVPGNVTPLKVGSVRLTSVAAGVPLPVGFLIFGYDTGGVTVTSAAIAAVRSSRGSRIFVEGSGTPGSPGLLQTAIAVSNPDTSNAVRVSLELRNLDGSFSGRIGFLDVPAGGQVSRFLGEIPGFEGLPQSFQGVLRVLAQSPVSLIGIRARYNERREFLITTVSHANESDEHFNTVLRYSSFVFPHFVDGGGYNTEFVLFSAWTPGQTTGALEFFGKSGDPQPIGIQP